ncbi:unnamed protein product, partial [Linum tenue]
MGKNLVERGKAVAPALQVVRASTMPTHAEIEAQAELQAVQSFFTLVRTTLSRIAQQLA